ncbi:hypothetical protein AU468_03415 [Alkalispirochaeta sphaeroplastigenens]|uniref:Uncharacterized protein n=1 Tax=Alkalispirochaeta sphaeroplastigenens TaxID=1187066 RepID=A0A2S4JXD4_9SPIO|nr:MULTISPECIES: hypothetical protein [Alkalispirochaeta]POR04185.1 hypothetical protein AU468_03415 [Alkalispirochaeta sphaeroplastigenens]
MGHFEGTEIEISELRAEDRRHNARLRDIEQEMKELRRESIEVRTALIGPDGSNGLRRNVRDIEAKLDKMPHQIFGMLVGTFTILAALASLVAVIIQG